MSSAIKTPTTMSLTVRIFDSKMELGAAAAAQAASIMKESIRTRGLARIIVGTGPSQNEVIAGLTEAAGLDWRTIEVFHMDEYVGIGAAHPASFRRWLKDHLAGRVGPGKVHYLAGDAADLDEECRRYASLLTSRPVDISFLGFGENGHIAFNDPHVADPNDPRVVKRVTTDEACRLQQVREGHFPDLASVPADAITLTCPALLASENLICSVPDLRKARAVQRALEGPISAETPASLVRTHPRTYIYLDRDSASLLSPAARGWQAWT
jgi:glucosamine-6-phosphate deaminase